MGERASRSLGDGVERDLSAAPLPLLNDNPVWTIDPKVTPFRDVLKYAIDDGYSGSLGYASAAVMGDFVVVDMFGERFAPATRPPRRPRSARPSAPSAIITLSLD